MLSLPRRLIACLPFLLIPFAMKTPSSSDPNPPGQLIDLGGYKLHLWCVGNGDPTVVMSAGSADFSFDWSLVQPKIAESTRACTYDRGGEAWSDLGPAPRTMRQEAFDLHRLLAKAGIKGPYVLVGQSLGGSVVRVFAGRFPQDVAGMVTVDGGDDDNLLFLNGKVVKLRELAKDRPIPTPRTEVTPADGLSPEYIAGLEKVLRDNDIKPEIESPFERLPENARRWRLWALAQLKHWAATDNNYGAEETKELYEARINTTYPLGNTPLIVLRRDQFSYPKKYAEQMEREHKEVQEALSHLSRRGKLVVVPDSGHHIQLDAPQAVIDAIRKVLDEVKHPARG